MISIALPFVLRLSKDERRVFQQNRNTTADCQAMLRRIRTEKGRCVIARPDPEIA